MQTCIKARAIVQRLVSMIVLHGPICRSLHTQSDYFGEFDGVDGCSMVLLFHCRFLRALLIWLADRALECCIDEGARNPARHNAHIGRHSDCVLMS